MTNPLRLLSVLSLAGVAWAMVLVAALFAGVRLLPLSVTGPVAALLVLPGFLAGVLIASWTAGRQAVFELLVHLPVWAKAAAGGLFLAFWLAAAVTAYQHPGRAEVHDGQYVLYQRDAFPTDIDRATYERYSMVGDTFMLSVLGAFGVVGATACAALVRSDLESDPWAASDPE